MFCANCGNELPDGSAFCPKCGTKVGGTEAVVNQQNPVSDSENLKKSRFRILSKVALLLVVFGFFMPISCNQNGFQLMEYGFRLGRTGSTASICAFFLGVLFFAVIISIGLFVYNYVTKKNLISAVDVPCLIVSIASGLIAFLLLGRADFKLQIGTIFIILGWVSSSLFLILSTDKKTEQVLSVICIIVVIATVSITKIINYSNEDSYSYGDDTYESGYDDYGNRGFGMEHIGAGSDGRVRAWRD